MTLAHLATVATVLAGLAACDTGPIPVCDVVEREGWPDEYLPACEDAPDSWRVAVCVDRDGDERPGSPGWVVICDSFGGRPVRLGERYRCDSGQPLCESGEAPVCVAVPRDCATGYYPPFE